MFKFIKSNKISFIIGFASFAIFAWLQFGNGWKFSDPDGFYHAKTSQLLEAGKLTAEFPWLQFMTWKDGYANQHFLYHWLITPLNNIENLQWTIVIFGVMFVIFYLAVLRRFLIPWKLFWIALMLFGSVDFLFRINLVKANTLSLSLLCAIALILYQWHEEVVDKNKYILLVLLTIVSMFFVWTYGGFIFVPFFVLAFCVAVAIERKQIVLIPLIASMLGIGLGVIFHPHSTHFISLMYDQLFRTGLGAGSVVPAGSEWLPFNINWFLKSNVSLILIWLTALILEGESLYKKNKPSWLNMWMHATAIGLLVLTLWHRRFIEYWVPFAVLASCVTIAPYIAQVTWDKLVNSWNNFWQFRLMASLVGVAILMSFGINLKVVNNYLNGGSSGDLYKNVAMWLEANSEPGDIVFNTQWDQFPELFYWDSKNYYLVGMDPTFMYIHNPDLYWKWRKIADDNLSDWSDPDEVRKIIKQDLRSRYLFADSSRNADIISYLGDYPEYYTEVYRQNNFVIFEIK